MEDLSNTRLQKLQQKNRQFMEERMELLDTIREMVGAEVDKRMEQWAQRLEKGPEASASPWCDPK